MIPISIAVTKELIAQEGIGLGDEVFITGLFVNHFGKNKNIPIIRIGNISAMPEERVQVANFGEIDAYLIETRSIGVSGSPVFTHWSGVRQLGGELKLKTMAFCWLGLIHGHWNLNLPREDISVLDSLSASSRVHKAVQIIYKVAKIL